MGRGPESILVAVTLSPRDPATALVPTIAFECAGPAEVDELYAAVETAGFDTEKEPWDAFWGQRYAQLRDPDGVPVDLFAPL